MKNASKSSRTRSRSIRLTSNSLVWLSSITRNGVHLNGTSPTRVQFGKVLFMLYAFLSLAMASGQLVAYHASWWTEITTPVIIALVAYARFAFLVFDEFRSRSLVWRKIITVAFGREKLLLHSPVFLSEGKVEIGAEVAESLSGRRA